MRLNKYTVQESESRHIKNYIAWIVCSFELTNQFIRRVDSFPFLSKNTIALYVLRIAMELFQVNESIKTLKHWFVIYIGHEFSRVFTITSESCASHVSLADENR